MKYAELVRAMFHSFHPTDITLHHQQIPVLGQVTPATSSPGVDHCLFVINSESKQELWCIRNKTLILC